MVARNTIRVTTDRLKKLYSTAFGALQYLYCNAQNAAFHHAGVADRLSVG
jgi:hypothetical protein